MNHYVKEGRFGVCGPQAYAGIILALQHNDIKAVEEICREHYYQVHAARHIRFKKAHLAIIVPIMEAENQRRQSLGLHYNKLYF